MSSRVNQFYEHRRAVDLCINRLDTLSRAFAVTGNTIMADELSDLATQIEKEVNGMNEEFSGHIHDDFVGSRDLFWGTMGKVVAAALEMDKSNAENM